MWVKICGNTNLEDARRAIDAGADAVGFVFAPSPRQVTAAQVRRMTAELPEEIERYGVFVDSDFAEIVAAVTECRLTGVQIHRSPDAALPSRLRRHFAQRSTPLSILRVLNYDPNEAVFERQLKQYGSDGVADAVLVDSSTVEAVGGTGKSFDWPSARRRLAHAAPRLRIIVAGGLSPENVEQAIRTLRPWGVDVVSGVEAAPGKKDPARVLAFVRAAREAESVNGEGQVPAGQGQNQLVHQEKR